MSNKYALAVVIGRMQPVHLGHTHLVQRAMELADRVLVLFGDTGGPRTIKNPFTVDQRMYMLRGWLNRINISRKDHPIFGQIFDDPNDQFWIQSVVDKIDHCKKTYEIAGKVAIVGHSKDESSSYLEWFPQYDFVNVPFQQIGVNQVMDVDATKIRDLYFTGQLVYAKGVLPQGTMDELTRIQNTEQYTNLKAEYEYIQSYRKSWSSTPYPVIFSTVDAVVIQSGHVLLVRRGKEPGKGLYALPGGFLDQNERMFDASIRELKEETGIKIQDEVLQRCYRAKEIFDDPSRSLRGRTISTAFLFKLNDACDLPTLRPGKDPDGGTIDAKWVPFSEVKREVMFEDHYFIIEKMLRML
jgi:bifunctional NMN adenylyltransferase/nudix hydrolase